MRSPFSIQRIHYVPGLLSLALMLPLGLWYLQSQRAFRQERCVQLTFPPPQGEWPWWDSINVRLDPSIADTTFFCSGDLGNSIVALDAFRSHAANLAARNDTSTWLHVRFSPDVKYATVMHAMESCRRHLVQWWLENGSLMARYHQRPPRPTNTALHYWGGCIVYDDVVEAPPTRSERFTDQVGELWLKLGSPPLSLWPAIPFYLVLAYLGIRRALRDSGSRPE